MAGFKDSRGFNSALGVKAFHVPQAPDAWDNVFRKKQGIGRKEGGLVWMLGVYVYSGWMDGWIGGERGVRGVRGKGCSWLYKVDRSI